MYESFFRLQRRPFTATPDPGCAYQAGSIQTVIDELVVCLERGEGIAVLTAPAGLGKTLLCEKVRHELSSGFVTILLRHANFTNRCDLLRTLLSELGRSSAAASEHDARLQLLSTVADLRQRGQLLVVICDEAHQLTEPLLEELRQLVDHADHGVSWVRLFLTGQLELEDKLAGPELSALNQRLRSHLTLSPLSAAESKDYIDYRITWAGGRMEEIFLPETLTEIIAAADGIPRCLNQLCDHVLLLAYVAEQQPARPELVREALSDLQHLPLSWNVRAVRKSTDHQASIVESTPLETQPVDFGGHLSTWESSPTFADPAAAFDTSADDVWEFAADAADEDALASTDVQTPAPDAFETFLETVESELDLLEQQATEPGFVVPDVVEEPVMDRYAAIDAGWPEADLPLVSAAEETPSEMFHDRPAVSVPVDYPPTVSRTETVRTLSLPDEDSAPEHRIHTEVLELVSETQEAFSTRRIDQAQAVRQAPLIDELPANTLETPAPRVSAERPFRNLFTRLRRKQKGLE